LVRPSEFSIGGVREEVVAFLRNHQDQTSEGHSNDLPHKSPDGVEDGQSAWFSDEVSDGAHGVEVRVASEHIGNESAGSKRDKSVEIVVAALHHHPNGNGVEDEAGEHFIEKETDVKDSAHFYSKFSIDFTDF
jgi:hypothetical protein